MAHHPRRDSIQRSGFRHESKKISAMASILRSQRAASSNPWDFWEKPRNTASSLWSGLHDRNDDRAFNRHQSRCRHWRLRLHRPRCHPFLASQELIRTNNYMRRSVFDKQGRKIDTKLSSMSAQARILPKLIAYGRLPVKRLNAHSG